MTNDISRYRKSCPFWQISLSSTGMVGALWRNRCSPRTSARTLLDILRRCGDKEPAAAPLHRHHSYSGCAATSPAASPLHTPHSHIQRVRRYIVSSGSAACSHYRFPADLPLAAMVAHSLLGRQNEIHQQPFGPNLPRRPTLL